MKSRKGMGHLFAVISVTAWGTSFLVSKGLMTELTPIQLMWIRFVIAYAAMWMIYPRWYFCLKEEVRFLVLALIGNTIYFLAENTALQLTQATNVSILVSTAPILSALMMRFFGQSENLSRRQVIGFGTAFVGVLLVILNGVFILKLNPAGDLLAMAAAFLWAAYGFVAKQTLEKHNSFLVTRKLMLYGIVTSAPLLLAEGKPIVFFHACTFGDICSLLYLGLICSAVCYLLWNNAIDWIGALKTNMYVYAVPLVTMLASAAFLKEKITGAGLVGIILVVGGMMLSSLANKKLA